MHGMYRHVSTYSIYACACGKKEKDKQDSLCVCVCVRGCAFNVVVAKMPPSSEATDSALCPPPADLLM